jgi:hypothetical protein
MCRFGKWAGQPKQNNTEGEENQELCHDLKTPFTEVEWNDCKATKVQCFPISVQQGNDKHVTGGLTGAQSADVAKI